MRTPKNLTPQPAPPAQDPTPTMARSWASLARALAMDRSTLRGIRARYPDHPKPSPGGAHNVADWRTWLDSHAEIKAGATPAEPLPKDRREKMKWEIRRLKADALRREFEADVRQGLFLRRDTTLAAIFAAVSGAQTVLRQEFQSLPFQLAGLREPEIAERLELVKRDVDDAMRKMFASLKPPHEGTVNEDQQTETK